MKVLFWIGIALTVIGIGGYFTVADDLRHKGELIGVSTILLLGLLSLAVYFFNRRRNSKHQT
jgi:hypothetical protein